MITTAIDRVAAQALMKEGDVWEEIAARVKLFIVTDEASADYAASMIKQARAILKSKEEERKTITGPLLAAKNATDAYFKPATQAIQTIIDHYKGEIGRFKAERERERVAVLTQSAAEIAQGIVPTAPIPAPVHVQGTTIKAVWDFEITDALAVPRELCSPDEAKIRQAIWYADTEHTPPRDIPGVRFFLRERVTVR